MAKAMPSLEDHLTCAICFEVYRKPHMLKCLHTYCAEPCLKQLARNSVIVCPDCRKPTLVSELKQDFRTQSLINLHNQQQSLTSEIEHGEHGHGELQPQFSCEMCDNVYKEVKFRCIDCKLYICNDCHVGHAKIKSCEGHKIVDVEDTKEILKINIKSKLLQLKDYKTSVMQQIADETKCLTLVTEEEDQQMRDINDSIDEIIISINEHRADLHRAVKSANETTRQKLQSNLEVYEKYKGDLDNMTGYLTELMQKPGNISTTLESVKEIDPQKDRDKVQSMINNINMNSPSPVSIKKIPSCTWIKTAIDVLVTEQRTSDATSPKLPAGFEDIEQALNRIRSYPTPTEQVEPPQHQEQQHHLQQRQQQRLSQLSFQALINCEYTSPVKVTVPDRPYALVPVNNRLWCCTGNQIVVLNKQLEKLSVIEHGQLRNMRHLTQCKTGDVIVACDDGGGLHRLDSKGAYIGQIASGSFSSVYSYRKKIAVLSYTDGIMRIMMCKGETPFEFKKTTKLQLYENGHYLDKLVVVNDKGDIMVSSFTAASLYQYNSSGELIKELGIRGPGSSAGTFKNMILCGIDTDANILVSDYLKQRLQVYVSALEEWRILGSLEFGGWPLSACAIQQQQLLYVTTWNKQLLKYKIKN